MQTHRILVIDNDQEAVETIMDALEPEGFLVFSADKADEGIDKAKKIHPSVVFVNIVMPGQSGLHVCKEIQSIPGLGGVPIIMLTIRDGAFDPRYTELFGILDVLKKPLDPDRVLGIAHTHLKTGVDLTGTDDTIPLERDLDTLFSGLGDAEPPAAARPLASSADDHPFTMPEPAEEAVAEDIPEEVEIVDDAEPVDEMPEIFVPDLDESDTAAGNDLENFSLPGESSSRPEWDDSPPAKPEDSLPHAVHPKEVLSSEPPREVSSESDDGVFVEPATESFPASFDETFTETFESEEEEPPIEPYPGLGMHQDDQPRKRSRVFIFAGIGLVVLLVAAAGAWYFLLGESATPPATIVREPVRTEAPFKPADAPVAEGQPAAPGSPETPVPETVTSVGDSAAPGASAERAATSAPQQAKTLPASSRSQGEPVDSVPDTTLSPPKETPPKPATPAREAQPGYGVQLGAFSKETGAEELATKVRVMGYPVEVVAKGGLYKVVVGPYPSWVQAKNTKDTINQHEEFKGAYLVSLP